MKIAINFFLLALLLSPSLSLAYKDQDNRYQEYQRWWPPETRESHPSYRDYDNRNYNDRYYERDRPYDDDRNGRYKQKHRMQRQAPEGWDINPQIAKNADNCYRYTLSVDGNRGAARILSLPGTNYIQTSGQKSGYVCFDGSPTLELGKLGDRGTRVTLRLEGRGKYTFNSNDPGSSYKNNWYRSYWGL